MSSVPRPIVLITGGNRGLGRAAALKLAEHGVDVIFTYRGERAQADAVIAEIVKRGAQAIALQLDVSRCGDFAAFADQVRVTLQNTWQRSQFNFLINNAGFGVHASFEQTTEAQFDELMKVHFKGVFFLTQKLLPLIADGGRILNLSSGLARFSLPGYSAYAAMKGAIEVLTRYQAMELARDASPSTCWHRGPLRPISVAAPCATTRTSTAS